MRTSPWLNFIGGVEGGVSPMTSLTSASVFSGASPTAMTAFTSDRASGAIDLGCMVMKTNRSNSLGIASGAGFDVTEIDSGCCGMAGSFGFEKEHYDLSLAIANRRLAPAVRAADPNVEIVASGISCRQQIEHVTGRKAKHVAEVLWESLANGGAD
jgi:hypothetical protein